MSWIFESRKDFYIDQLVNHVCPCLDSTLLRAALAGTILSQIIFHCVWMPLALDQNNCFVLTFKMCFLKLLLVFI